MVIKYKTGIVMHKAYHNSIPGNIQNLHITGKSHYNTRTSSNNNFHKFCACTYTRQSSIDHGVINVLNSLVPELK